ncbi:hypothetical protein DERP_002052 [Dermatophagoides pteronyssinus]|uniref:Uncharacterized protein n=1 Tax=Dermatophagoides pteronyssinus TaxID=6956 RepID=A0ABQ8JGN1_DERPT|nr:hypothetical protein DERP_002052 [Dermatophagoides pteronyssinus]
MLVQSKPFPFKSNDIHHRGSYDKKCPLNLSPIDCFRLSILLKKNLMLNFKFSKNSAIQYPKGIFLKFCVHVNKYQRKNLKKIYDVKSGMMQTMTTESCSRL